ncbi:MAG: replication-associated recombination protein A [Melioribacteraceae bacterium]|nr:replication-associated recombination protein A [Melioribacteraceae bacterium]
MNSRNHIPHVPLAERIRPRSLKDFKGQEKLVGSSGPIRSMIDNDKLSSFILWGPPGSGKTTLARIISKQTNSEFYQLNAVSSGVKEVREIIRLAKTNKEHFKRTILFIDEIHRFNKSQQDALLAAVESGDIILIGATTENPSFEVIPPLRSRARVYTLNELNEKDLNDILEYALTEDEYLKELDLEIEDRNFLFYLSGGDARSMLNILEDVISQLNSGGRIFISNEIIEKVIQKKNILYDKSGEEHYNIISAFIKSIRGSDPDAALYWLARMLEGGEDSLFIARRLIILASEDIGNASPNALVLAEACFSAVDKIGMPESRIILAQCVTYLASSPKSNSSYTAIEKAVSDVRQSKLYAVPVHLRNAPTSFMKNLGYGSDYKYPHDHPGNFVPENYLPEEMKNTQYYFPSENGQEKNLKERLKNFWNGLKKY